MKWILPLIILLSCASEKWTYKDLENWEGECQTGKLQSPISLDKTKIKKGIDFKFNYHPMILDKKWVHKTLHAIPRDAKKSYVTLKGIKFFFHDIHFHVPASHAIKDRFYIAEVHLVHYSKEGERLVLGAFYKFGKHNKRIENVGKQELINPQDLLPKEKSYYHYIGSLTTPPCTEGVNWVIMKTPLTLGRGQIESLMNPSGGFNNRPPQPRNNRIIYEAY